MRAVVVRPWWVQTWRGSLAAVFAFLTVITSSGLTGLVALFGGYALLEGVTNLVMARARYHAELRWQWLAVEGAVGAGVGLTALFGASMNAASATVLMAVWALGRGVAAMVDLAVALRARRKHAKSGHSVSEGREDRAAWVARWVPSGLFSVAFGVLLLTLPGEGSLAGVLWIGAFALVSGTVQIGGALRIPLAGRTQPGLPIILPTATGLLRAVPIRWRTRLRLPAPR